MKCYIYLGGKVLSGEEYNIRNILKKAQQGDVESLEILKNAKAITYGQRGVAYNEKQELTDCFLNYAVVLKPTEIKKTSTGYPTYIYESEENKKGKEVVVLKKPFKIFEAEDRRTFIKKVISLHNVLLNDDLRIEGKKERTK